LWWTACAAAAAAAGIKGAPKKVQLGVSGLGLVVFDIKGRPTGTN
jgi:hypothetical protein